MGKVHQTSDRAPTCDRGVTTPPDQEILRLAGPAGGSHSHKLGRDDGCALCNTGVKWPFPGSAGGQMKCSELGEMSSSCPPGDFSSDDLIDMQHCLLPRQDGCRCEETHDCTRKIGCHGGKTASAQVDKL
jgi:hypothetical protein